MLREHKKDYKSGIEILQIKEVVMVRKTSPLLNLLQIILINMGVYGCVFSFISGLDIEVYTVWLVLIIFACSLYYFVIYQFPKLIKYTLGGTIFLYLVAGIQYFNEIKNGFWHIENIYIDNLNNYLSMNLLKYLVGEYKAIVVVTIFLVFVIILITQVISSVIFGKASKTLYIITSLPIAALPFTVGKIPGALSFFAYLACTLCVIGMGKVINENQKRNNSRKTNPENKNRQINNEDINDIWEENKNKTQKRSVYTKSDRYNKKSDVINKNNSVNDRNKNMKNNNYKEYFRYNISLKSGGFLAFLMLVLVLFFSIFVTPKFYEEHVDVTQVKEKLQKEMREFSIQEVIDSMDTNLSEFQLFKYNVGSGGLSSGKLGRIGEVRYNNKTALKINTPVMGESLYLKGYVGSVYKGDYWDGLSDAELEDYENIALQWENSEFAIGNQSSYYMSLLKELNYKSYENISYSLGIMDIESVHANRNYIYAPYYSVFSEKEEMDISNSEYVTTNKRAKKYSFEYYNTGKDLLTYHEGFTDQLLQNYYAQIEVTVGGIDETTSKALEQMKEYQTYEKIYREFVYDVYTKVPEEGLERLINEFGGHNYADRNEADFLSQLVSDIKEMLARETSYSLSPGVLPKGEDFVDYFLYENKVGYCAHYASAATLIFRLNGIPARYVEGYVVKESNLLKGKSLGMEQVRASVGGDLKEYKLERKAIEVTDANAHSWVEIYLEGFGWVPIEVTPGYLENSEQTGETQGNRENDEISAQPRTKVTPIPTTTPQVENLVTKGNEGKNKEEITSSNKTNTNDIRNRNGYILFAVTLIMLIIFMIGILILRARFVRKKRKDLYNMSNSSEKALILYNEIKRIFTYYKTPLEVEESHKPGFELTNTYKLIKEDSFIDFKDILLKAKFAPVLISDNELETAENFCKDIIDSIYLDANYIKKFYLFYIRIFG